MRDPYIREKFTRDLSFARQLAPALPEGSIRDRVEFTMRRLREPVGPPR